MNADDLSSLLGKIIESRAEREPLADGVPGWRERGKEYAITHSRILTERRAAQERDDRATLFAINIARLLGVSGVQELAEASPVYVATMDSLLQDAYPENQEKDADGKDAYDRATDWLLEDVLHIAKIRRGEI